MKRRSIPADLLAPTDRVIFAQQTCEVFSSICLRGFGWKRRRGRVVKVAEFIRVAVNLRLASGQFVSVEFKPRERLKLAGPARAKAGAA